MQTLAQSASKHINNHNNTIHRFALNISTTPNYVLSQGQIHFYLDPDMNDKFKMKPSSFRQSVPIL